MPKAVISNRIYMDLPPNKQEIFDALTYRIEQTGYLTHGKKANVEIIRNYRMITPTIVSIPQGRTDLIPPGYEIIDKRILEFEDFPAPRFELFPEQTIIYDEVLESCFINALPGWGKTFTALHIAAKLGQKTLVVTHTSALRDQWVGEVEKLYGFRPGIIGAGNFSTDGAIVVGNVQSLVNNMDHVAKSYGTLIMDEAHHTPASTFTSLVNECHARYRIALSGTMTRKDGKHVMFPDYFGPKVLKPPQNNTMNPTIHCLKVKQKLPPGKTWADKVTALLEDREYIELIATLAAIKVNEGHKVLIVADRVQFMYKVQELLGDQAVVIVGETKDRDAEMQKVRDGVANVICGSRQIFSEGISLNILSCLIMAVPIVNPATLEQVIGRIMRLAPGKLDPIVLDMHFQGRAENNQASTRLSFYLEKQWEVKIL